MPRSSGDTASRSAVHIETKVWTNVISSPSDAEAWTVGGSKRKSRRNELESYASAAVRTRRFFYARNAVPPETGAGANQPEVKKWTKEANETWSLRDEALPAVRILRGAGSDSVPGSSPLHTDANWRF